MKKRFALVVALALLTTLLAVAPVSAGAIVTRTETEVVLPEGNFFSAPCPDSDIEDIYVEGKYIIKTTTVLDGNGKDHFSSHFNWEAFTGTGAESGDTYVVTQAFSLTEKSLAGEDDLDKYTLIFSFHLVSKGSGENIQLKGVNHLTVNANGELTVDKATFRIVCK
jgi:hypothetical protein